MIEIRVRMKNILLVEDNLGDIRLTQEALKEANVEHQLFIAKDGEEALNFLKKASTDEKREFPDLIFLDLNLPRKDGREVLREIKQDPALKLIPVVVLTTSDALPDIEKSYQLHANCYITKPVDINQFIDVVKSVEHFWFKIVKLPTIESS